MIIPSKEYLEYEKLANAKARKHVAQNRARVTGDLREIIKKHIGERNKIKMDELVRKSLGDIYPRILGGDPMDRELLLGYWKEFIRTALKGWRAKSTTTNPIITVTKDSSVFVLQSEEELKFMTDRKDKTVKALEDSIVRATEWVRQEMWNSMI